MTRKSATSFIFRFGLPNSSYQLRRLSTRTCASARVPYGHNQIPELPSELDSSSGVCRVTINRPEKANALTLSDCLSDLLRQTDGDPAVKLLVLTGTGKFFTSGNDIPDFRPRKSGNNKPVMKRDLVGTLIDFRKPLIALVNGPAVGLGVTMLAHCDAVYATQSAYFLTPFTSFGLCAEACSSYLFPKMMGNTRATEILMLNAKLGSDEAANLGLVTRVFPDYSFAKDTASIIENLAKLPSTSLMATKELIRGPEREKLHAVKRAEFERVRELAAGEECKKALQAFVKASGKK